MSTSEQLEHEAEAARAKIVDSLAELRDRLTPGVMIDEALGYARDKKGGALAQNLGRQIVNNPLPVSLIGAGIAWLLFAGNRSNRHSRSRVAETATSTSHRATRTAEDLKNKASVSASNVSDRAFDKARAAGQTVHDGPRGPEPIASGVWPAARDAGSEVKRKAGAAGSSLAGAASSLGDAAASMSRAASSAYGATAKGARRTASVIGRSAGAIAGGGRGAADFLKDEPLVLAGIGLALGAVIGAALRLTDPENRLMGKASDSVKQDAVVAVEEAWERGKEVVLNAADKAWEEVRHAVAEENLTPEGNGRAENHASTAPSTEKAPPIDEVAERDVVRPSS